MVRVSTTRDLRGTHPLDDVLGFLDALCGREPHIALDETPALPAFSRVCRGHDGRGKRVPDAYLAALAIANARPWSRPTAGLARYSELSLEHPPGR